MQPGNELMRSRRKPPALRARSAALALTAVAALGLAACSSSSSGGASTSPASSAGAAAPSSGAAGQPYQLVSIQDEAGSNAQLVKDGTTAAIDAINAAGGIDGHQVELSF